MPKMLSHRFGVDLLGDTLFPMLEQGQEDHSIKRVLGQHYTQFV